MTREEQLRIKQKAAHELAGTTPFFRKVEVFSIVSFWALTFGLAYKISGHWNESPWLIMAAFMMGFVMADFVSGFVHWLGDTWGSTEMPILGKALIRPFREHHVDQTAIARHDYIETNGSNCMVAVPVAAGILCIPLGSAPGTWHWVLLFSVTAIGSMNFWVMLTNQFHKWAHTPPDLRPKFVGTLQRWHLILPPEHHAIHHKAPFAKYYCITSGWLNWPLMKIGFFRHAERLVTAVTGLIPRKDDIGVDAALAIAPLTVSTGEEPHANPTRS